MVAPVGLAALLTNVRIDGRPAHRVAGPFLRLHVCARRLAAFRPAPLGTARLADLAVAPDESGARLRTMRVNGPASMLLRVPVTLDARGRTLIVEATGTRPRLAGKRVELRADQRMVAGCVHR